MQRYDSRRTQDVKPASILAILPRPAKSTLLRIHAFEYTPQPPVARLRDDRRAYGTDSLSTVLTMSVSVVVPIYNERENVPLLYEQLTAALPDLGCPWEILFVDDGSTDGSSDELPRLKNGALDMRTLVRLQRRENLTNPDHCRLDRQYARNYSMALDWMILVRGLRLLGGE